MRFIRPSMTLEEARQWLDARRDNGVSCPCCGQYAKVYARKLISNNARTLIALSGRSHIRFTHLPTLIQERLPDVAYQGGYVCLSAHWGLMEEERVLRPDGGRAGWWRITALGTEWVRGRATIPKYAYIFDSKCLGFDGPDISIEDVLGEKFNYEEMMKGE